MAEFDLERLLGNARDESLTINERYATFIREQASEIEQCKVNERSMSAEIQEQKKKIVELENQCRESNAKVVELRKENAELKKKVYTQTKENQKNKHNAEEINVDWKRKFFELQKNMSALERRYYCEKQRNAESSDHLFAPPSKVTASNVVIPGKRSHNVMASLSPESASEVSDDKVPQIAPAVKEPRYDMPPTPASTTTPSPEKQLDNENSSSDDSALEKSNKEKAINKIFDKHVTDQQTNADTAFVELAFECTDCNACFDSNLNLIFHKHGCRKSGDKKNSVSSVHHTGDRDVIQIKKRTAHKPRSKVA